MVEVVVGQEPPFLAVIAGGVSIADEKDLAIGNEADVSDEFVNLTPLSLHVCSPH
jgi:hypothetical protein